MTMSFSNETVARVAVKVIERFGYSVKTVGTSVWTDCPALLAIPAIGREVGLHRVEEVQVVDMPRPAACSRPAA